MKNARKEKYYVSNENVGTTSAMMSDLPIGIVEESYKKTSKMTAKIIELIDMHKLIDNDSSNPLFKTEIKCDKRDKFDKRIGKDIVGCVVDRKYHVAMVKRYKRVLKILFKAIEEIETLIDFHDKKVDSINADLQRCYT